MKIKLPSIFYYDENSHPSLAGVKQQLKRGILATIPWRHVIFVTFLMTCSLFLGMFIAFGENTSIHDFIVAREACGVDNLLSSYDLILNPLKDKYTWKLVFRCP